MSGAFQAWSRGLRGLLLGAGLAMLGLGASTSADARQADARVGQTSKAGKPAAKAAKAPAAGKSAGLKAGAKPAVRTAAASPKAGKALARSDSPASRKSSGKLAKADKRLTSKVARGAGLKQASARQTGAKGRFHKVKLAAAPRVIEPAKPSIGQAIGLHSVDDPLALRSSVALVADAQTGQVLYEKNGGAVLPIASITKLMTAMVVIDSKASLKEVLEVSENDRDTERNSRSRLPMGSRLTRLELLNLALMSSENRAASALGRHHPGGEAAFALEMNAKARQLGLSDTHFTESTGLSSANVSTARDLAKMVQAASRYPLIRELSTASELTVDLSGRATTFRNTNRLVGAESWGVVLQKTGYISEAGQCLVMMAHWSDRPVIMVFLDSSGRYSRLADAQRVRDWLDGKQPAQSRLLVQSRAS